MMIPSKQIAASSATMPSKLDPHILKSKAITMQRIGLCVANGSDHLFAVQGEVELTNGSCPTEWCNSSPHSAAA